MGCDSEECPVTPAVTGNTERQAITLWNQRSVNSALDFLAQRRAELGEKEAERGN